MGPPPKHIQLVNKIRRCDEQRVKDAIGIFENLNKEVPLVMQDLISFAKGTIDIPSSRLNAIKTLLTYHEEIADKLAIASEKLIEENTPKEEKTASGNVTTFPIVTFSTQAVDN